MTTPAQPRYSFVIPVFNEADTLPELLSRLIPVLDALDGPSEVMFVDDGSSDASYELLRKAHERDARLKVIRLARNFGHQLAITAGLDAVSGEAVVIMDADLQDPPELVPELINCWCEGYEVVYAIRQDRTVEPLFRRLAISLFYRVLRRLTNIEIPVDAGDFRLVDRRALEAFRAMRENNRYVRGMFAWVGFRQIGVPYRRDRRFAGRTKYPLGKLVRLGANGVVSFSNVPLWLTLAVGFLVSASSFLYGVIAITLRLSGAVDFTQVPGWVSIIAVTSFIGGIQLVVIGMMGIYVGRIYEEVKRRPLYVVDDVLGRIPPDRVSRGLELRPGSTRD